MYFSNLYPTPKVSSEFESERFHFSSSVTATVCGLNSVETERVKYLWYRFSCNASVLNINTGENPYCFQIGKASCELEATDAYAIHVDASGVCVVGKDAEGLMSGIKTLVQLICPEVLDEGMESLYITAADVHDAPEIDFRAIHLCVFAGTKLHSIEQAIHLAGFLKMTHVILEFWGTLQYECQPALYWKDRSFSKAEVRELVQLSNSYGMEMIPMINHFGHAAQARRCHGRHVVLNQNPRLSRLFEPDGWTWCVSNPDTYKLLAEMRAEQMELFGDGKYFHLGFDEADSFATCDFCNKHVPHELLAEYLDNLTKDILKAGRRPIIWHDMLIRQEDFPLNEEYKMTANGAHKDTYRVLDFLDKRLIIADWNYNYKENYNPTTPYFIDKGFDTLICPWDDKENIRSICSDVKKYGAKGVIMTTWNHSKAFLRNASYWANCAWSASENNFGAGSATRGRLLGRLCDGNGSFEDYGWGFCDAEL